MCGIVGVAGTGPMTVPMKEFFASLLLHDVIRGHHATGVAAIDTLSRDLTVEKKAIASPQFLEDKEAMDSLFAHKHNFNIYIGHNRFATSGAKDDDNNAHPFIHGNIVGVHNGSLRQQNLLDNHKDFKVDSDNLFYHLNKNGLEDTVMKLNGAAAIVWYDRSDNTLNFYRNDERPLAIGRLSNGSYVWASEIGMLRWLVKRHKQLTFEQFTVKETKDGVESSVKYDNLFSLDKNTHIKLTYKDRTRQFQGDYEENIILPPEFPSVYTGYEGYTGNYRGRNTWQGGTSHGNTTRVTRGGEVGSYNKTVQENLAKFITGGAIAESVLQVKFIKIAHEKTSSGYEATIALFEYEAPNGKNVLCHAFVHNGTAFIKDWTEEKNKGSIVYGTICTVSPLHNATYECTKNEELGFALSLNMLTEKQPNKFYGYGKVIGTGGANAGKNVVPFQPRTPISLQRPVKEAAAKIGSTSCSSSSDAGVVEGLDNTFSSVMLDLANCKVNQKELIDIFKENGCMCSNCGNRISQMPVYRLWRTTWFDRAEGNIMNYLSCSRSCYNMTELVMTQLDEDYDKIFGGKDV